MMLLALGLIQRYVAPTLSSSGGAIGEGGAVNEKVADGKHLIYALGYNRT